MDRLMLLDGNGLIYRGYFALPPLTTSRGELVNAVFGFCSIVLRGFQDIGPDYVAVAFDLPGPTFRHERFAEYKATRQRMPDDLRDQFPKVREVVKALRIPVYEFAGYEADDVIGTLTVEAERRGLDTTIVTGDLDMLQLVTEHTRLMTTRSGVQNTVIYDPERIRERYELRPDQIVDFKALKGDSTDNVPGVPGVGEKTAARLINRWETLDALYEHIDEVEPVKLREPLLAARERVLDSRELMRIVRDLPVELDLEAARLGDYDRETVVRLFREYEFRTLIERLPPLSGERADETVFALRAETADGSFPAAQVAGRAAADGGDGQAAPNGRGPGGPGVRRPSLLGEASGLQLSMDFDALGAAGGRSGPALGVASGDPDRRCRVAGRPARRGPARRARGAHRRSGTDRGGRRGGRARSPVVARGPAGRRRRAAPGRSAPAPRDGARARRGGHGRADDRGRRRRRGRGAAPPARRGRRAARRPRGQAPPRRRGRRRPAAAGGRIRHAGRRVPAQREPAQPDDRRRRRRAARPHPAGPGRAGRRPPGPVSTRCRPSPPGRRSSARSPRRTWIACSRRSSCRSSRSSPGWRRPASRIDRDRLSALATRVRDRDRPPGGRDLRRRRPRVQPRQSRSSSSRSSSSSSTCPRASGRRPATRPTRRCSRTCARPTR